MLFEKRKEWNSVVVNRDMATEGSRRECRQGKMFLMFRGCRCKTCITGLQGNKALEIEIDG
jgi:hypothetical protein